MRVLSLVLVVVFAGCLPGEIDELSGQASTRVVRPSSAFEVPGFGSVVAGVSGNQEDGTPVSRLAVTGGEGTPFALYEVENGSSFDLRNELFSGCATRASGCDVDFGASAVGLPSFDSGRLCVAFGAPGGLGALNVVCESLGPIVRRVQGPIAGSNTELGRALAALPASRSWGVAIAGAPGVNELYVLDAAATLYALPTPEPLLSPARRLGEALAVAALPDALSGGLSDAVLVAAWQPGLARLALLSVGGDAAAGGLSSRLLGCVDALSGDVSVAVGDVTGDGVPVVFFSDAQGPSALTHSSVQQLSLADLAPENGCGLTANSDDPPTTRLSCPDLDSGVTCAGFGETLALGDLDADGDQDLLVGAPDSDVDGVAAAGAVFVFPATPSGFDEVHRSVLVDSHPDSNARLGAALSTVKTGLTSTPRDEPVVGAPGANRVFVFLCSGIPGDSADAMARCLP
jgi:hypothetical protein